MIPTSITRSELSPSLAFPRGVEPSVHGICRRGRYAWQGHSGEFGVWELSHNKRIAVWDFTGEDGNDFEETLVASCEVALPHDEFGIAVSVRKRLSGSRVYVLNVDRQVTCAIFDVDHVVTALASITRRRILHGDGGGPQLEVLSREFGFPIAIGTIGGRAMVVDIAEALRSPGPGTFGLHAFSGPPSSSTACPVDCLPALLLGPGQFVAKGNTFAYGPRGSPHDYGFQENAVCVSSLYFHATMGVIAVGLSFGCWQVFSLRDVDFAACVDASPLPPTLTEGAFRPFKPSNHSAITHFTSQSDLLWVGWGSFTISSFPFILQHARVGCYAIPPRDGGGAVIEAPMPSHTPASILCMQELVAQSTNSSSCIACAWREAHRHSSKKKSSAPASKAIQMAVFRHPSSSLESSSSSSSPPSAPHHASYQWTPSKGGARVSDVWVDPMSVRAHVAPLVSLAAVRPAYDGAPHSLPLPDDSAKELQWGLTLASLNAHEVCTATFRSTAAQAIDHLRGDAGRALSQSARGGPLDGEAFGPIDALHERCARAQLLPQDSSAPIGGMPSSTSGGSTGLRPPDGEIRRGRVLDVCADYGLLMEVCRTALNPSEEEELNGVVGIASPKFLKRWLWQSYKAVAPIAYGTEGSVRSGQELSCILEVLTSIEGVYQLLLQQTMTDKGFHSITEELNAVMCCRHFLQMGLWMVQQNLLDPKHLRLPSNGGGGVGMYPSTPSPPSSRMMEGTHGDSLLAATNHEDVERGCLEKLSRVCHLRRMQCERDSDAYRSACPHSALGRGAVAIASAASMVPEDVLRRERVLFIDLLMDTLRPLHDGGEAAGVDDAYRYPPRSLSRLLSMFAMGKPAGDAQLYTKKVSVVYYALLDMVELLEADATAGDPHHRCAEENRYNDVLRRACETLEGGLIPPTVKHLVYGYWLLDSGSGTENCPLTLFLDGALDIDWLYRVVRTFHYASQRSNDAGGSQLQPPGASLRDDGLRRGGASLSQRHHYPHDGAYHTGGTPWRMYPSVAASTAPSEVERTMVAPRGKTAQAFADPTSALRLLEFHQLEGETPDDAYLVLRVYLACDMLEEALLFLRRASARAASSATDAAMMMMMEVEPAQHPSDWHRLMLSHMVYHCRVVFPCMDRFVALPFTLDEERAIMEHFRSTMDYFLLCVFCLHRGRVKQAIRVYEENAPSVAEQAERAKNGGGKMIEAIIKAHRVRLEGNACAYDQHAVRYGTMGKESPMEHETWGHHQQPRVVHHRQHHNILRKERDGRGESAFNGVLGQGIHGDVEDEDTMMMMAMEDDAMANSAVESRKPSITSTSDGVPSSASSAPSGMRDNVHSVSSQGKDRDAPPMSPTPEFLMGAPWSPTTSIDGGRTASAASIGMDVSSRPFGTTDSAPSSSSISTYGVSSAAANRRSAPSRPFESASSSSSLMPEDKAHDVSSQRSNDKEDQQLDAPVSPGASPFTLKGADWSSMSSGEFVLSTAREDEIPSSLGHRSRAAPSSRTPYHGY